MLVQGIGAKYTINYNMTQPLRNRVNNSLAQNNNTTETKLPIGFNTSYNISFGSFSNPNRLAGDIDIESYNSMTEKTKQRYRKLYKEFSTNDDIDKTELYDTKTGYLPLRSDDTMEKFIKASKIYLNFKDQPIICLGRSPKWFLNAAYWMKDGIQDYKFAAFSSHWFCSNGRGGVKRVEREAPTEKEEMAYRKYLDRIGADPKTIVDTMKKEGKKTVITDYICSGKGACSFLDIMSRYANDLGILEDFSKSIKIVGIGSLDYMEMLNPLADTISMPRVPMPPLLEEYGNNIEQEFHDMDYFVFEEMLLNRNTNECRSTYYPHNAWTVYSPDKFKTGMVKDMKKVERLLNIFKNEKYITSFTAPMQDYRNLLNFRILDYLNSKDMLRETENFAI